MQMTPNRPYLLRAFYEWIVDNNCTPYLVVDATLPGVRVPPQYVKDGQIVLNVSPGAVGNLSLGNDEVTFNARFGGSPFALRVPQYAVLAIYARENGAGTMFAQEEQLDETLEAQLDDSDADVAAAHSERPQLTPLAGGEQAGEGPASAEQKLLSDADKDKAKKGNHLRVIK